MLEFKYCSTSSRYLYIETNTRLGMCNYFDTSCGVNTVAASYDVARGAPPPPRASQRDGVVFLSLHEDLYARYRAGESLWGTLGKYFCSLHRKHVGAYWDWRDPRPGFIVASRFLLADLAAALRAMAIPLSRSRRT